MHTLIFKTLLGIEIEMKHMEIKIAALLFMKLSWKTLCVTVPKTDLLTCRL
jgi:hypothetical protein